MSILRLRLALTAFVTVVAATAVLAPPADAGKVYPAWVIPEVLKVRSGPGTDRDQIGSLTKGTKVYVTSFSNNWCWAKLPDGRWGWIAEWLLQFSADKGRALAEAGGVSNGSSSSSSSSSDYPPAWIVPETTNVRSGPGTQYEMRGQLSRGTKVYVVTRKSGWSKCRTPGGYGWIRDDLLERNADTGRKLSSGGSSSTSTRKAFVNGDGVRLRSGPGTNHSIRASLTKGQTVFVTGTKDGWASVSVQGGASGWVSADLLKYEGTTSVPSGGASSSSGPSSGSSGGTMKGFVDGSSVHLRSGPSLSESIRAKVVKGQTLYIT
ncbi:MAG TPA: hypothetical protein DEP45_01685, partial [Armatimonadetes bacterium]|nr:hypothetical protein [Armatimonadota bacterium]